MHTACALQNNSQRTKPAGNALRKALVPGEASVQVVVLELSQLQLLCIVISFFDEIICTIIEASWGIDSILPDILMEKLERYEETRMI